MTWWILTIIGIVIYVLGFGFTLAINSQLPVTQGLGYLRAAVWPIWWTTGWPHGERLPMD
jgi:hypothetical protein